MFEGKEAKIVNLGMEKDKKEEPHITGSWGSPPRQLTAEELHELTPEQRSQYFAEWCLANLNNPLSHDNSN